MDLNLVLPFISTGVMLVFTLSVLQRWWVRRRPAFLFWGIGLAMFGAGSFAEAYFAGVGWSRFVFFLWYFFGAVLNAGWIGHGTYWLLAPTFKRSPFAGDDRPLVRFLLRPILSVPLFFLTRPRLITGLLIGGSVGALALMLLVMPRLDPSIFDKALPISEQYREIMPAFEDGGYVRLTTPFFNIYGTIMLAGGALWSAWLFLRKQILPNRVLGNVLIAAGAISIGIASSATRLGEGGYLYLGELIAAILMYAGFTLAARPATEEETAAKPASAMA